MIDDATIRPVAGALERIKTDARVGRLVETELTIQQAIHRNRRIAPAREVARPADRVRLARAMLHGEHHRDALLIVGLRIIRRMRLTSIPASLGAHDMFGATQWQQIAQLGRVGDVVTAQHRLATRRIAHHDRPNGVAVDLRSHGAGVREDHQSSRRDVWRQHRFEHRQPRTWLRTEA